MDKHRHYRPIADYGLIGAMHTCALVSRDGSIDWCCLPSFDSPAVFGRILDWQEGGYFQVVPRDVRSVTRRYLPATNVLETTFTTDTGVVKLTDFMPVHRASHSRVLLETHQRDGRARRTTTAHVKHPRHSDLIPSLHVPHDELIEPFEISFEEKIVRILECVSGSVQYTMACHPRFDYGLITPRTVLDEERSNHGLAHGGASALLVYCSAPLRIEESGFRAEGPLRSGERLYTVATCLSHFSPDFAAGDDWLDTEHVDHLLDRTVTYWREWSEGCTYKGEYRDDVLRSALALKTLTYEPSGALLAAATTSLPEGLGGERNWDYRFTWIRDATFSLKALFDVGLATEARAFKDWLEWTTAYPEDLQLMYGIRGERYLHERELPLEGYFWSRPVRVGNGAHSQFQLDIYGELMDSAYLYYKLTGEPVETEYWGFLYDVTEFTINCWRKPDAGIWETRGGDRHFVFSKVMCWVAIDRAIKLAEAMPHLPNQLERWQAAREEIRAEILSVGFDKQTGTFVQCYGSRSLDAATLMLPLVGFIEADDPRMRATIEAIEHQLTSSEGLVYRYKGFDDGLAGSEGTFTICSFWLVQNLILLGHLSKARSLFEKLRGYANDLGLFSEEVDTTTGEMLGNFPQAFSHLAFIQSAVMLEAAEQEGRRVKSELSSA